MTLGASRRWDAALERLVGASFLNLVLQAAATGFGLAASLLLTRLLGAEGYGVYAFAMTLATVLTVVTRLGLDSLLMREVAVAHQGDAFVRLAGVVRWGFRASGALSVVLGVTVTGGAWLLADAQTAAAVTAAMVMLLPMTWLVVPAATLRGLDRPVIANVPAQFLRPLLFLLGVGVLVATGITDPVTAVVANAIAHAVALLAFTVPWRAHWPAEARGVTESIDPGPFLAAAPSLMLLAGLSMIVVQADLLMLKGLASDAAVGVYAVVAQVVRLVGMPLSVVNRVVAPRFAASHAIGDLATMQRTAGVTAAGITAVTVPVAGVLAGWGPAVLGVFGPEFTHGITALQILLVGQIINALCGSVGTVLLMIGRERELGVVSAASAALNLLLNFVLIPRLGIVGAAIASSASLALFNVVLVVRVRWTLGLDTTVFGLWRRLEETSS